VASSSGEAKLAKIARDMHALGTPNSAEQQRLFEPMKRFIKGVVREEFTRSVDPSGRTWKETVRGKPALVSKKLPNAFLFAARDGSIVGVGKSKRDMLEAHQTGYTFRARQVAALKQFLTFDKHGRLIGKKRAISRTGKVKRGAYQVFAREHKVGARVLPERQIVPEGTELPRLWDGAMRLGFTDAMQRWYDRTAK
jgi:hypothetical protein